MGCMGILVSMWIGILDQGTDIFSALLFYLEGHLFVSILTLFMVFFPGLMIAYVEIRGVCSGKGKIWKAFCYLLFAPLWTIILHLYSICDERYVRKALLFKTVEGFLESGPQLALQLSLLFRGILTGSSKLALDPLLSNKTEDVVPTSLEILGRVYDESFVYWFGWIHVFSIVMSFISIFSSAISFNDLEGESHHPRNRCGKITFGSPFTFFTLIYRSVGLALIICFMRFWSAVIIFALFFINVLTALYIGDDFPRSTVYGFWSLFIPVGYNRDPSTPLGYRLISETEELPINDSVSIKDIERSHSRARLFLTSHILASIFILGGSLAVMILLILTNPFYYQHSQNAVVSLEYLTSLFIPILGLSLAISVLLARPYFRFDCSGGESPKGNIIL